MLIQTLLAAHIVVLGYWLGAELVINSTYRYVSWASALPFAERNRLMDHVLDVDQHVRYALILQAGLGTTLAALLGYIPGHETTAVVAAVLAVLWLLLVEATHRLRKSPLGKTLAGVDGAIRYVAIVVLLIAGAGALIGYTSLPGWLSLKLALFAGVIASGLGIRVWIIRFYKTWHVIARDGSTESLEHSIRQIYVRATSVLALLWSFIAGITALSVWH